MSNSTYPPLLNLADIDPLSTTSSIGLDGSTTSVAPAATTSSAAAAVTTSTTSAAPAATTSAQQTSAAQTSAAAATSSAAAAASSSSAAAASSARTTAAPTSAVRTSSVPVVLITITSTDSSGAVVTGVSSSAVPTSSGTAGASSSGSGSSSNLGAIIGGVAGGVAGLIILIWLILLPLRRRAKKQKEVEWLAFGQENDHVNESSAEAIYGRGAGGGGGGEGKGGSVANVNEIQMDEMADQPYHYQNLAAHSPSVQQQPGQYDAYYGHPQQAYGGPQYQQPMHYPQQQQQAWAGSQPQYSPEAAWGAAPGYVSPTAQSIANHGGLSHSMSVGSKAPTAEPQPYLGSQDGHGQYGGYASPPLGPHSPQQYPQHYQGQPQPYAAHNPADAASQRSGSPQSVQHDRRPGNTGLHLANP